MRMWILLVVLFGVSCADAPVTVAQRVRTSDETVWLSRAVPVGSHLRIGGEHDAELMTVTDIDGMTGTGMMQAHVQRGDDHSFIRRHDIGERVLIVR